MATCGQGISATESMILSQETLPEVYCRADHTIFSTMDASFNSILADCSLLGIDPQGKSFSELEVIYWKAMYTHLATHIEQMQAAYERVLLGEYNTVAETNQYERDVALLTDHFLSRQPFDLLDFLRRNQPAQYRSRT